MSKTVWSSFENLEIELTYDPAILLLGIYQNEINSLSQTGKKKKFVVYRRKKPDDCY